MTENWIYNEKHDRLTMGDNDVSMVIPQHQLRDYARMAIENRPISLPAGFYIPSGWNEIDGDVNRVTVRLSRYNSQLKSPKVIQGGEVKLCRADMVDWGMKKTT